MFDHPMPYGMTLEASGAGWTWHCHGCGEGSYEATHDLAFAAVGEHDALVRWAA